MTQPSKGKRQRMIADWLRAERVGSQEELVARLSREPGSARPRRPSAATSTSLARYG